jgi:hypothetical protein
VGVSPGRAGEPLAEGLGVGVELEQAARRIAVTATRLMRRTEVTVMDAR